MFTLDVDEEISLKLLEIHDTPALFQLIDYSRGYLREWLPWVDGTRTLMDAEKFIQNAWKLFDDHFGLVVGIFFKGRLAGVIGFNMLDWTNRIGVIGYWLGAEFQGNGIMTRSASTLIDYGFHQLRLNRIEIRAAVDNVKSRAIPERLGFTIEGQARQGEWLHDHFADLVIYGMLANEWTY